LFIYWLSAVKVNMMEIYGGKYTGEGVGNRARRIGNNMKIDTPGLGYAFIVCLRKLIGHHHGIAVILHQVGVLFRKKGELHA